MSSSRSGSEKGSLRLLTTLCAFALLATSCSSSSTEETTVPSTPPPTVETTAPTPTSAPTVATTAATATTVPAPATTSTIAPSQPVLSIERRPKTLAPFASLDVVPLLIGPAYRGPATPTSMNDVIVPTFLSGLEPHHPALEERGFAIDPDRWYEEFHHAYKSWGYADAVFFVTTDVAYHYLHLAFSKVLREAEEHALLPVLEDLVAEALADARELERRYEGHDRLAEPTSRVRQYFEAASVLLGTEVGSVGPLASAEAELALQAASIGTSPITSYGPCDPTASAAGCIDYSLFKPRGHYTRSADLERFFRAMSFLGQASFFLDQPDSVLLGALTSIVISDPDLADSWSLIYEPTAFMVGAADDFTPLEVTAVAEEILPGVRADPALLVANGALDELVQALLDTRSVQINAEAASIRTMGARFVIDSWILDQLVYEFVGTPADRRVSPSALDVSAAFGSEMAFQIQDEAGETSYERYVEQLDSMRQFVANRPDDAWAGTVYDAWLHALEAVWAPRGSEYPDFMQTDAWAIKDLQTGLGSYAELKHDTILYAKQYFAAEGDFPPAALDPRHWVEPNPAAFGRLAAVLGLLGDGLEARGLLSEENEHLIGQIQTMFERFARIAADELAGRPISDADNEWLEGVGFMLEALWVQASDWDPDETELSSGEDWEIAVIADIGRNTDAIHEIGIGLVNPIYVLVPNDDGQFQVAVGGVYSFYEFWQPADQGRLTDQEWRAMLADSPPDRPAWTDQLYSLAGAGLESCGQMAGDGWPYEDVVAAFVSNDRPLAWDHDRYGIPCRESFGPSEVDAFFSRAAGVDPELFCRDIAPLGFDFADAVAYWLLEGAPDRMDADRNGIPCETVYSKDEIDAFFGR